MADSWGHQIDEKRKTVVLLVLAEVGAMSLWFVSSAVLGDMTREFSLNASYGAAMASAVQGGFVLGALFVAVTGLADRFDPRRVFALSSLLAATANLAILVVPVGESAVIILRLLTGFCLAGVYPVGMKIAVGWGDKDRGWLVGLVVGGLTVGSAMPHLLSFLGGVDWRVTTVVTSAVASLGALIIMGCSLGPLHGRATRFRAGDVLIAWTDKKIRLSFIGYLGHMWELYAMWAWIAVALVASYSLHLEAHSASQFSKLTAFCAIGAGALLCPVAGRLADRIGKARVTILAMIISAASAMAMGVSFGGPVLLVFLVALIWGMSVIPDSAQFSAMIADFCPPERVGSVMTFQTALGFALTVVTVQATPVLANLLGWPAVFVILALGPIVGIVAMLKLERLLKDTATINA